MAENGKGLVTAEGGAIAKTMTTVAAIKHCGDCRHAILMAQPDGRFDFQKRHCLEGPPHYVQMPVMRQTLQGPQVVGMQAVWTYPEVGITMRACSRWAPRNEADVAAERIDVESAKSDTPLGEQRKN